MLFKVLNQEVQCPVCRKTYTESGIRSHIANMARREQASGKHRTFYDANTYEEVITIRHWKV